MPKYLLPHSCRAILMSMLLLTGLSSPCRAQQRSHGKIFSAYFEEWNIHYSGRNLADFEKNGVAGKLTYLIYAFGIVSAPPSPACVIADPLDAYQNPAVPSVSGKPYAAPLLGNYGA